MQQLSEICYLLENWLKRHSTSTLHLKNVKATAGCSGTLTSLFTKAATRDESSSIEIELCAFIAEHNLRVSLSDDFVEFLRSLFPPYNLTN